jgi:hypothetical protein
MTTKTEGLSFPDAGKRVLEGGCARRKAWPKEAFIWRRKSATLSPNTNDPYLREAFCRCGDALSIREASCYAKLDYVSRCKGLPTIILGWQPDKGDINATDWEVFDVPNTYEDREVRFTSLEDAPRHPGEYTHHEVYNLMKGIFPEKMKDPEARRNLKRNLEHGDFLKEMTRVTKIMKGLDDLLK